ncbi:penicillin acylase family protein [Streptomyces humi]|uniref:penicillin acylase family protein n=1 Tax=Streptomyces humi TaxID=1428620 RepID=UPI0006287719|nr:penicillin acylase family protein [Streptomyces humi]
MTIETYRDAWGIPHLRAGSARELARAQGRVTAHDRAWQLEVERHRAQGTSASFLGASAVAWDVLARRARLADTARRCFEALERRDPETAQWVRSYTAGVNEGLPAGAARTPEFARAGLAPGTWEPWHPLAVWLTTHILFAGFPAKLWRERATRHLGPASVPLFAADGPATAGSNGWLLAGSRTTTGHALLAGDPHRYLEAPGVYQQIRLACPEFDVVGLAVPGVPGIAHFAHAGTVAWSITNAMADYQDLYRERLRRTETGAVLALGPDGVWTEAERHTETVETAGQPPLRIDILETPRGPVITEVPEAGTEGEAEALALRYPPRVTHDLGFTALLPLLRARRVADVDRALDSWAEPVNVVHAADTAGGTLHRVAGRVPLRSQVNRTRLAPAWLPGHEWQGWHETPYGELTDGAAVMANQRGLAAPLGVEFAPPHRADRIRALLDERRTWSAADLSAIHMDTHLASAAPLLDRLAALDGLTPEAAALRDRLLVWDRRMDADSTAAADYAAVRSAVVRHLAAHPAFAPLTETSTEAPTETATAAETPTEAPTETATETSTEAPTETPTKSPVGSSAELPACPEPLLPWLALIPRIAFALEHLLRAEELYGVDRPALVRAALEETAADGPAGTWGDTHRLAPWQALPERPYDGPALSGDHDCVLCTTAVPGLTDLSARGPAARYVWDLARREDSLWVVPLGADGVPGAAHHTDQLPLWTKGELIPVDTDWERLELVEETDTDV